MTKTFQMGQCVFGMGENLVPVDKESGHGVDLEEKEEEGVERGRVREASWASSMTLAVAYLDTVLLHHLHHSALQL